MNFSNISSCTSLKYLWIRSAFSWMTTMIRILSDFKLIRIELNGEHMPEERSTGSKIDLNFSAGSTYTRVYTVLQDSTQYYRFFTSIASFWYQTGRDIIPLTKHKSEKHKTIKYLSKCIDFPQSIPTSYLNTTRFRLITGTR